MVCGDGGLWCFLVKKKKVTTDCCIALKVLNKRQMNGKHNELIRKRKTKEKMLLNHKKMYMYVCMYLKKQKRVRRRNKMLFKILEL